LKEPILLLSRYIKYRLFKIRIGLLRDEWNLVCPCGIGDTYIVCCLAREFIGHNKIDKLTISVKQSHQGIPILFRDSFSRVAPLYESYLHAIGQFGGFGAGSAIVAHPSYTDQGLIRLLGVRDINLMDMYKALLRIPHESPISKPKIPVAVASRARERFKRMNLPFGKTVILAPEAVSSAAMPLPLWHRLSDRLKEAGFEVCTNCVDPNNVVPGTHAIFFPLEEAITMSECAGWMISSRSGLCDLISSSACRLTVLYRNQEWLSGTLYSISNLNSMGLSHRAHELIVNDEDELDTTVERIIDGAK